MEVEIQEKYTKAGKIAAEALQYGKSLIKKDAVIVEILDQIEQKIKVLGGEIAFPAQISLNNTAAHFCPDQNDPTTLQEDVIKLDLGVHIEGYVADNALTVDLSGENKDLVKASREALNSVLPLFTPGRDLEEIGAQIQKTINSYGFKPVSNLSGHALGKYIVHAKPSVPNIPRSAGVLQEDMVMACEPFASKGQGLVREKGEPGVYSIIKKSGVRDPFARKVLDKINTYNGLPFAKRWLTKEFGEAVTSRSLLLLERGGIIRAYPPLNDIGLVSQAEHSIIVKEKPIVFTRL